MAAMNRTIAFAMVVLLTIFGAVWAQDDAENQDQQDQTEQTQELEVETTDAEEFVGDVEVGEPEPFDTETEGVEVEVETGALILSGSTPDDQNPNIDLVGPNGYYEHFEIDDDEGADRVIDGLLPGTYSVAATDDGLQVAHALVDVVQGEAVRVHVNLSQVISDFRAGAFTRPVDTRARGFRAGDPRPIESAEFGAVAVDTDDDDGRFVVTGPDNYSRDFTGSFQATDLPPGIYIIAGTGDNAEIATTAVEVEVSTATTMVPARQVAAETEEVEGDVAGGGEAEDAEDAAEAEDAEDADDAGEQEQPAEPEDEDAEPEDTEGEADAAEQDDEIAGGGQADQTVRVSLIDLEIDMPTEIPAGRVTFEVTNDGDLVHNFEIEGQGVEESFDEDLQPGESKTMTVDIEEGDYYVYCPVDDHEEQGMALDVEAAEQQ